MGIETDYFIGAVILLAAFIYGAVAYSRRNRANEPITNQATRELYKDEDSFGEKEDEFRAKTRS